MLRVLRSVLVLTLVLAPFAPGTVARAAAAGSLTAFQANTGELFTYSDGFATNTHQGMMTGTNPSIASGGYEIAFQTNTGHLEVTSGAAYTGTDTQLGMMSRTSPSIAALPWGGYEIAFQANTTELYTYDVSSGAATDTYLGMMPGTSPTIAALPSVYGYVIAFQANTGELYTYERCFCASNGVVTNTRQGMMRGTSPSIAVLGGGYEIAFQTNTGDLKVTSGAPFTGTDTLLGMMWGTSPSIAAVPSMYGYEVAFQANTGELFTYDACFCTSNGLATDTYQGMMWGTSPSIAALPDWGWVAGFQANTSALYTYERCFCESNGSTNTYQGMAGGTSPSVPVPTDTLYPDASIDADPGQSVTAIVTDPGCIPGNPNHCQSIINVGNTSRPLTSAQQALVDQDLATASWIAQSGASAASVGTQIVVTRTLDTTATTSSCSRGCTRYAFTRLCSSIGCWYWGQHTNENFWFNGSQAWGGPGVNSSWIDCSNSQHQYPITGIDETMCWFHPDGGPWHNPAYASKGQHLSADNRFVTHFAGPKGISLDDHYHIYFWDYPSGKVKIHAGHGY